jgi:hypothetical protein
MFLTIRVTLAIIFGALALWSQTPFPDNEIFPKNENLDQQKGPVFALTNKLPQEFERSAFSLNLPVQLSPKRSSDGRLFYLAEKTVSTFKTPELSSHASSPNPAASGFSHGYFVRRKIHKYVSYATMPLIVSQAIVGQKLNDETDNESGSLRSAHSGLTAGLGIVFGAESVTGIWNMLEARKNHVRSKKHLIHGILMLAADAGFVATAALAPGHEEEERLTGRSNRASTHRAVGYASLGIATAGYVYMLIAR